MATSDAEVCNLALLRIGVRRLLDDLDEATPEAEACAVLYPHTRDTLLARARWPFATRRAALAARGDITRTDYAYAYALPSDCVAARGLWDGRALRVDERTPWTTEDDGAGTRVLLTDQADAELVYTARVSDVTSWPPLFTDAVAWALAAELVLALAVKPDLGKAAAQRAAVALALAGAAALQEAAPDNDPDAEAIAVRG